jgi:hypothetical protein
VTPSRRRTLATLAAAAIAGTAAGIVIGLAEDDNSGPSAGSSPAGAPADLDAGPAKLPEDAPAEDANDIPLLPSEQDPGGAAPGPSGPPPAGADEEAAASAARGYVQALDRRSGAGVCRALAPDALDGLRFPVRRASCPASVEASLGFARRGMPVWRHSEMTDAVSAEVTGDAARVVATVFTTYADVREPTIEDDIIQLEREDERWLIVKPSLTLYRAIGDADPPASALAPPG